MSNFMIAVFFGVGVSGWAYAKLVRANGNPSPYQDLTAAAIAGVLAFGFLFTLLKFVLGF